MKRSEPARESPKRRTAPEWPADAEFGVSIRGGIVSAPVRGGPHGRAMRNPEYRHDDDRARRAGPAGTVAAKGKGKPQPGRQRDKARTGRMAESPATGDQAVERLALVRYGRTSSRTAELAALERDGGRTGGSQARSATDRS